jgi:cytochrome c5
MGDLEAGGEPAEGGIAEVPNPSAAMAKKSGKPLAAIQRGHEVYMLQCGQCHKYKLPQDLDIDEWETAVPKMIGHAGLESADEKAVLDYVVAVKIERGEE